MSTRQTMREYIDSLADNLADNLADEVDTTIHKNLGSEISGIAQKATPVDADIVLIEDSAASFNKKKVLMSSLLGDTMRGNAVFVSETEPVSPEANDIWIQI